MKSLPKKEGGSTSQWEAGSKLTSLDGASHESESLQLKEQCYHIYSRKQPLMLSSAVSVVTELIDNSEESNSLVFKKFTEL